MWPRLITPVGLVLDIVWLIDMDKEAIKERKRQRKRERKKASKQLALTMLTEEDYEIDPTSIDPDEYKPLMELVKEDEEISNMWLGRFSKQLTELKRKIEYRVLRVFKIATSNKHTLSPEDSAKLIDLIATSYESVQEYDGVRIRILPIIQLYSRTPLIIQRLYFAEEFERMNVFDRCVFISAIACEYLKATLVMVEPETTTVPTLVVICETDGTDPRLGQRMDRYPNCSDELHDKLTRIANLKK